MLNKALHKTRSSVLNFSRLWLVYVLLLTTYLATSQTQTICVGSIKNYAVDTTENGGLGTLNAVYQWSVLNNSFAGNIAFTIAGATNAVVINWGSSPPGNYTVRVIETNTSICVGSAQILQVTINPLPIVRLNDAFACVNPNTGIWLNTVNLQSGLSNSSYFFSWTHDSLPLPFTTSNIAVSEIGNYNVTATNVVTRCMANVSAIVAISSAPNATLVVTSPFQESQTITVNVSGFGTYEYALNNGPFQESNTFEVQDPGIYSVVIRDKYLCGEITLTANVINFPQFVTPNGDGFNDDWAIVGLPLKSRSKLTIFDRYGKLIKQSSDGSGWNGTLNGIELPADDYWFTLEYTDNSKISHTFNGHFSLKR